MRVFCFGVGFVAKALARAVLAGGGSVAGTARTADGCRALAALGIDAVPFGPGHPELPAGALAGTSHLVSSVPPDDGTPCDPVLRLLGDRLAAELSPSTWIGYLSSTAVYGDHGGAKVDEDSANRPSGAKGRRRLEAEAAWLALANRIGGAGHAFRLAGIYGPGRSALDQVRAGTARRLQKPGGHLFNRIHADDAAAVLLASMAQPRAGGVYNVADDVAAESHEVTAYACDLLGVAPPPLEPLDPATLSPAARGFWVDRKTVANRRIKTELEVRLRYPSYREGLAAILAGESREPR
ncbi:MAG: SDR family NAD(P)-dependent oxidoreductase [Rhodospirillaceae bacterium]|nr:SDR family NAD(P)-dependent oxidoreductase [Rhodospirillaceae bacterium]